MAKKKSAEERNFVEDLGIDQGSINSALANQAGLYVYWAMKYIDAKAESVSISNQLERAQKERKAKYEILSLKYRLKMPEEFKDVKVTESSLASCIAATSSYKNLVDAETELIVNLSGAKLEEARGYEIREAFKQRANLMQSLSANLRDELEVTERTVNKKGVK